MQLRSVGAYHVGQVPRGAVALPDTVLVRLVVAAADMVVGLFKDGSGNDYFMIVNDYEKAVRATVTLAPEAEQLLTLDVETRKVISVPMTEGAGDNTFEAQFRPGAGHLYFFAINSTDVEGSYGASEPLRFSLRQNYPNPFNL